MTNFPHKVISTYRVLMKKAFNEDIDGARINQKMISLGKFEKISSNIENHFGTVVTERNKVEIKSYLDLNKLYEKQNKQTKKSKFNLWKFIMLKND